MIADSIAEFRVMFQYHFINVYCNVLEKFISNYFNNNKINHLPAYYVTNEQSNINRIRDTSNDVKQEYVQMMAYISKKCKISYDPLDETELKALSKIYKFYISIINASVNKDSLYESLLHDNWYLNIFGKFRIESLEKNDFTAQILSYIHQSYNIDKICAYYSNDIFYILKFGIDNINKDILSNILKIHANLLLGIEIESVFSIGSISAAILNYNNDNINNRFVNGFSFKMYSNEENDPYFRIYFVQPIQEDKVKLCITIFPFSNNYIVGKQAITVHENINGNMIEFSEKKHFESIDDIVDEVIGVFNPGSEYMFSTAYGALLSTMILQYINNGERFFVLVKDAVPYVIYKDKPVSIFGTNINLSFLYNIVKENGDIDINEFETEYKYYNFNEDVMKMYDSKSLNIINLMPNVMERSEHKVKKITVKEFLKSLDKQKLLDTIFENYYKDRRDVLSRRSKYEFVNKLIKKFMPLSYLNKSNHNMVNIKYGKVYDTLMNIEPKDLVDDSVILNNEYIYNGEAEISTTLYPIKDIIEKFKENADFESVKNAKDLTEDEMKSFDNIFEGITKYSYEIDDWENVLGYRVIITDDELKYDVAASILYEITFYGYDEETIGEFKKSLEDTVKEIEESMEKELKDLSKKAEYKEVDEDNKDDFTNQLKTVDLSDVQLDSKYKERMRIDGFKMLMAEYYSIMNARNILLNEKIITN